MEGTQQWPLTAAATQMLLKTAPADAKRGSVPVPKDAVKLALKELIMRGAYRITVQKQRYGRDKLTLEPGEARGLPASLQAVDEAIRPHTPGEIGDVFRRARRKESLLMQRLGKLFRTELIERGLIEERREKLLGLLPVTRCRRTASGDAWAQTAAQHQAALQSLPSQVEANREWAVGAATAAGSLALLVPAALPSLSRMREQRGHGEAPEMHSDVGGAVAGDATFDPIGAVGDLLDSAAEGIEGGIDAVDSALDSVADSIDSAVDAGVDAGGGDGGDGGDGGNGGGGGD